MADSQLTNFQERKIERVFNILYDSNHDGYIEENDFVMAIDKVCKILEWPIGGDKHKETQETLELIWKELRVNADVNADDRVSRDEWLSMWKKCIRDDTVPEWQQKFMDFMFKVNDKSGDNQIDKEEYTTYYRNYISLEECEVAFQKISDKGLTISQSRFRELWKEYFFSDDRTAKGNYLFGVPEFLNSE